MTAPVLELYCDGSGDERVGRPGGWAFVAVREGEELQRGAGRARRTTSLLMELAAATEALQAAEARGWAASHQLVLVTDCAIAVEVAEGRFIPKPPLAAQAAAQLRAAALRCGATARWVKAHAGEPFNELVDALASEARLGGSRAKAHAE